MKRNLFLVFLTVSCFIYAPYGTAQDNPYEAMPVADADGNLYKTIMTEDGVWMAENLRTTRYNDGTAIPIAVDKSKWEEVKTPLYCWYKDDNEYKKTVGAIYNWHTVATGKLCPKGWHVPTEQEWVDIMDYAGGAERSGDNPSKLKEAGTAHWKSPNEGATNSIFFTALPAGELSFISDIEPGTKTSWWTSTEDVAGIEPGSKEIPSNAAIVGLSYDFHSRTAGTYSKESVLPVRCKMD